MNWLSFCIGAFIGAVIGAIATKIVDVIWNKGEMIITERKKCKIPFMGLIAGISKRGVPELRKIDK